MNITKDRAPVIKQLLSELNSTLKMSVQKATQIGQLLCEQKKEMNHGEFLPWLESNFEMKKDTAYRYMRLNEYYDKIRNVRNLQEAYRQIEQIEQQQKQTEEERKRTMIAEYRRTGNKPDGWDRSLDYAIKKDEENRIKYEEQKKKVEEERENRAQERKQSEYAEDIFSAALNNATEELINKTKERSAWKDKIRLSDSGKDDSFIDAIMDYLDELSDDNRRIEACTNIIKVCKNISQQLQMVK